MFLYLFIRISPIQVGTTIKNLNYNNLTNITRLYKVASSFAASAANV